MGGGVTSVLSERSSRGPDDASSEVRSGSVEVRGEDFTVRCGTSVG